VTVPADRPPGDPFRATTIAHGGRTILGPTSPRDLEALLDAAGLRPGDRVLDIGCGKGDLLVRAARRGATGLGIDRNPAFLDDARRLAAEAGLPALLRFRVADAAGVELDGDHDLVACIGATGALGGPLEAPAQLVALARPGGAVLIGEGFWRHEPATDELASFGIEPGELVDRATTLARMAAGGLRLIEARDATLAEWDAYEDDYAGALERWVAANPDDPDAGDLAGRAALFRDTWAAWRRDAMGFVTALLRREPPVQR
jgi:SAM-dependent methyltransferase